MEPGEIFTNWYIQGRKDCKIHIASKNEKLTWLWKLIHKLLVIVTLGKNNRFYTNTTTTLGRTIYYPAGWTVDTVRLYDCIILRHEIIHVRQYLKWGFGNIVLGTFLMAIAYLLLPVPLFFAWFRYKLEREAYWESYRASIELGLEPQVEHYAEVLTNSGYFWAWYSKKQVQGWFEKKKRLSAPIKKRLQS